MDLGDDIFRRLDNFTLNENFNYDALDNLGYSKSLCEKRVQLYEIISNCGTELIRRRKCEAVDTIVAGSRAEGVSYSGKSDVDILFVHRSIICSDSLEASSYNDVPFTFQLDFENVPNGYSKLRSQKFDEYDKNLELKTNLNDALVEKNGHDYFRNDRFITTFLDPFQRQGLIKQQSLLDEISGPARTVTMEMPFFSELCISTDCVLALKCHYPSILEEWCQIERKHSWPRKDLIERVKKLDVLVVPAGCKGSEDEELQWRISLTLAEQALVHSFNDFQIKLYAALKMISNHYLKPISDNITSYILKNVLFSWFESNDINNITKNMFDETLMQILSKLRVCITWRYLPCYMIPSKNMLQNKIFEHERVKLIKRLDHILLDRHSVLRMCPMVKLLRELSCEEFENMVAFRELIEQSVTAIFWVSATCPRLTSKIWDYNQRPEHVYKIIVNKVFPIIRKYNPLELFDRIISTSKEGYYRCMDNGIKRGYNIV